MHSPSALRDRRSITILMADDDEDDRVLTADALRASSRWSTTCASSSTART